MNLPRHIMIRAEDGTEIPINVHEHAVDRYIERHAPGLPWRTAEELLYEALPTARQTRGPDRDGCARWHLDLLDLPVVVGPPRHYPGLFTVITVLPHRERRIEVHRLALPRSTEEELKKKIEEAQDALRVALGYLDARVAGGDAAAAAAVAEIDARATWARRASFVEHGIDADLEGAA